MRSLILASFLVLCFPAVTLCIGHAADWQQQEALWNMLQLHNAAGPGGEATLESSDKHALPYSAWTFAAATLGLEDADEGQQGGGISSSSSSSSSSGGDASTTSNGQQQLTQQRRDAHYRYCRRSLGGVGVNVIMVADPGTFSGSPERMHYVSNLRGAKELPRGQTMCASKTIGKLMGHPTVVIASGIGPVAAAVCTIELLSCGTYVREVVYVGTSGWSPQLGGVLSTMPYKQQQQEGAPWQLGGKDGGLKGGDEDEGEQWQQVKGEEEEDGCQSANPSRVPNRIGDMCVSPFAVNWMCKKADYEQQCAGNDGLGLCTLPGEISGPSASQLYGQCEFTSHAAGQVELADEILAATRAAAEAGLMPRRNNGTQAWEERYWGAMANSTGVAYEYDAARAPAVYDYTQCVEVDGQTFYTGPPFEMAARTYAAETINAALNTSLDMTRVIAVSAMEAIGLDAAMELYNALPGVDPIPYVNVRGMSNQLHKPVGKDEQGAWRYSASVQEDYVNGYKYAIATTSTGVLSMYAARCRVRPEHHADPGLCSFKIDYP